MTTGHLAPVRLTSRQMSVRTDPCGGDVARPARFDPDDVVREASALTLLVHGFATDTAEARKRYSTFRAQFGEALARQTVEVFWPGDVATPAARSTGKRDLDSSLFSVASYPLQISRAVDSAANLVERISVDLDHRRHIAAAIGRTFRPLRLRIVAHSLGCLLTLELLKSLRAIRGAITLDLIVLMAAAVPRYRLRDADFGRVLVDARQVRVYRSYNDWTLAAIFHAGQLLENPFPHGWFGARRAALGRHGWGKDPPPNLVDRQMSHGHGQYWFDSQIAREVADAHRASALVPLAYRRRQEPDQPREDPRPRRVDGRSSPDGRRLA